MFCKKCGNELREGALFCPNCGSKVAQAEVKESVNAPIKEEKIESVNKEESKENNFNVKKYFPIIAVVVVVVVIIGAILLVKPKDTSSDIVNCGEQNQTKEETQKETQQ